MLDNSTEYIDQIVFWEKSIKNKGFCPIAAEYKEKFPSLSNNEIENIKDTDFPIKKSTSNNIELPKNVAGGWGSWYIFNDEKCNFPSSLDPIYQRIKHLNFDKIFSRIVVFSLETNGYIMPHSDPAFHVSIPIFYDSGFKFIWQDLGNSVEEINSIKIIKSTNQHALYNKGQKRIFVNCSVKKFGVPIEELMLIPGFIFK